MHDNHEQQTITSTERSYFCLMPNLADDQLDVYEYRLYGHYKRILGEKSGPVKERTETTAQRTQMSAASVTRARKRLADKGYITLHSRRLHNYERIDVELTDIWPQNMAHYASTISDRNGNTPDTPTISDRNATISDRNATVSTGNATVSDRRTLKEQLSVKEPSTNQKPSNSQEPSPDDADLQSSPNQTPSSKKGSTRDPACARAGKATRTSPIDKHNAIRHLLTTWLPEICGYGGWDGFPDYLCNLPDYQLYDLATWFYRFRSRTRWAEKIHNPAGYIINRMRATGNRQAGLSPAERTTLLSYIDEADTIIRHIQETHQ